MDKRGRVTIPREIRERLGLKPGDRLLIKIQDDALIMVRLDDPFKVIEMILKNLTFDRRVRQEAEYQALRELEAKHGGYVSDSLVAEKVLIETGYLLSLKSQVKHHK